MRASEAAAARAKPRNENRAIGRPVRMRDLVHAYTHAHASTTLPVKPDIGSPDQKRKDAPLQVPVPPITGSNGSETRTPPGGGEGNVSRKGSFRAPRNTQSETNKQKVGNEETETSGIIIEKRKGRRKKT